MKLSSQAPFSIWSSWAVHEFPPLSHLFLPNISTRTHSQKGTTFGKTTLSMALPSADPALLDHHLGQLLIRCQCPEMALPLNMSYQKQVGIASILKTHWRMSHSRKVPNSIAISWTEFFSISFYFEVIIPPASLIHSFIWQIPINYFHFARPIYSTVWQGNDGPRERQKWRSV